MSSVKKNYLYSVIYQLLTIIVPLITTPYLARVLGTEKSGVYSYTTANVQYFILVSMLGIIDYGNRSIASLHTKEDRGRVFSEIYLIQFCTSAIAILFYVVYLCSRWITYRSVAMLQGVALLASLLDINWFFFGIEKFKLTVTRNIIIKIASLGLIFLFVRCEDDLWKYVLITVGSTFISNAILWIFIKKEIVITRVDFKKAIGHLKPCLILMLPLLSRSIFVYLDKTMLGLMAGMTETSYYDYSEKIVLAATSVLTPLGTVMLPRISSLLSQGKERIAQRYTSLSIDFVVGVGMALTLGLMAVSGALVDVFLGNDYMQCGPIVRCMSLTIILVGWTNVIRTQYILPYKKDKVYTAAVFLGAVVDFLVNIVLIPRLGALGAALGWVAAEIAITLTQTLYSNRKLPIIKYIANNLGFVINSIIMYLFVATFIGRFGHGYLEVAFGVLIGVMVYSFLTLLYLKIFRKDLWKMLMDYLVEKSRR